MLLTPRDLAIVEDVWRFRLLTTTQIETLRACDPETGNRFASRLTLTRRLKLLFHHRYLRRIARPLAQGSREPVYLLDSAGARLLSQRHGEVTASPPSRLPAPAALDHLLAIGQMRLSLTAAQSLPVARRSGYGLVEWLPGEKVRFRISLEETGRRRQNVSIVPDGAAIVRLSHGSSAVRHYAFIEVDRGTEPQRTLAGKCQAYLAYWQSGGFARDFSVPVGLGFRVLFVAPSSKRAQTILKAVGAVTGPRRLFRVALEQDIVPQRVLEAVWLDGATGEATAPFAG
ncbi:MAG: replication-relaxation family protein [Abitibacteriaceae bacterium]|nr:replication-relaxation family protein [Abditibacteriaceae bacterium]